MRHHELLEKIQKWKKEGYSVDELARIIVSTFKSKETMFVVFISLLILFSGSLGGILVYADVYDEVQSRIVEVLCLSCIKLDPKTQLDFTFETANGQPYSNFVLAGLTRGPVFLAFREDVCTACDIMEPITQEIFSVEYEKEDAVYKIVPFDNANITFIHINIDHTSKEKRDSLFIYDKDHIKGVPMFTIITLGYDRGFIKPYYTTAYGTLGLDKDEDRKELLTNVILDAIELYNENRPGYRPQ
ncbi:MAG: hypothetical protein KAW45_05990 [Thermoplasmatales archaeon]|nr:hypothetical protein [Thermoplasmatales archaeon]